MDDDRWLRTRRLFEKALALETEKREEFLNEACGEDTALADEVRSLIAALDDSDGFLEVPTGAALLDEDHAGALSGTRIGGFILEDVISSGGMGTVYRARQEKPARTVAVKVMREGLSSPAAVRRFEYEAQVLARLTHPNIAQVIEAGTHRATEGIGVDLPYFVMEYVPEAAAITEYARVRSLSTRDRLRLFVQACEAVSHGHRKGIIHRDLKPANILVDGAGQVKIIDFGVARATDSDLRLTTALTDVGQLIGTVQYMSPEQCAADPDDLDTRSDVYALGMVLYELLCEELPYDVGRAAIFEATRIVCETPPRRPSTVNRRLRGDVETIVLKTLEKERARRYQAVRELEADIQRYLDGDMIMARPVGPVTRLWMRVRRNPAARASLIVAFLAVVGFSAYVNFVSLPSIRHGQEVAEEERQKAVKASLEAVAERDLAEARRIEAQAARAEAEQNERISRATTEFLEEMLSAPNMFNLGPDARITDVLDRGAARIADVYLDQPEVELELRRILAWTYNNLARYEDSLQQWRAALAVSLEHHGEEHEKTIRTMVSLAQGLLALSEVEEARELIGRAVELHERILGPEHPQTLYARSVMGRALWLSREYEEAETHLRDVLTVQRRVQGIEERNTLYTADLLASVLLKRGRYVEGEELSREIVTVSRLSLGRDDPETLEYLHTLGEFLQALRNDEEAEEVLRELMTSYREIVGDEHFMTVAAMSTLSVSLTKLGKLAEAEELLLRALEVSREISGDDDPQTLSIMNNLAIALARQGNATEAREIFEEVLESRLRVQGPDHDYTMGAMINLASTLKQEGDLEGAEAMYREVLDLRLGNNGPEHPYTLQVKAGLAALLAETGGLTEAEELVRACMAVNERELGTAGYDTLADRERLGNILLAKGQLGAAEVLLVDGIEMLRDQSPVHRELLANYLYELGKCAMQMENWDEAEACLLEAHEINDAIFGPDNQSSRAAARKLVRLYGLLERPEDAAAWQARLDE